MADTRKNPYRAGVTGRGSEIDQKYVDQGKGALGRTIYTSRIPAEPEPGAPPPPNEFGAAKTFRTRDEERRAINKEMHDRRGHDRAMRLLYRKAVREGQVGVAASLAKLGVTGRTGAHLRQHGDDLVEAGRAIDQRKVFFQNKAANEGAPNQEQLALERELDAAGINTDAKREAFFRMHPDAKTAGDRRALLGDLQDELKAAQKGSEEDIKVTTASGDAGGGSAGSSTSAEVEEEEEPGRPPIKRQEGRKAMADIAARHAEAQGGEKKEGVAKGAEAAVEGAKAAAKGVADKAAKAAAREVRKEIAEEEGQRGPEGPRGKEGRRTTFREKMEQGALFSGGMAEALAKDADAEELEEALKDRTPEQIAEIVNKLDAAKTPTEKIKILQQAGLHKFKELTAEEKVEIMRHIAGPGSDDPGITVPLLPEGAPDTLNTPPAVDAPPAPPEDAPSTRDYADMMRHAIGTISDVNERNEVMREIRDSMVKQGLTSPEKFNRIGRQMLRDAEGKGATDRDRGLGTTGSGQFRQPYRMPKFRKGKEPEREEDPDIAPTYATDTPEARQLQHAARVSEEQKERIAALNNQPFRPFTAEAWQTPREDPRRRHGNLRDQDNWANNLRKGSPQGLSQETMPAFLAAKEEVKRATRMGAMGTRYGAQYLADLRRVYGDYDAYSKADLKNPPPAPPSGEEIRANPNVLNEWINVITEWTGEDDGSIVRKEIKAADKKMEETLAARRAKIDQAKADAATMRRDSAAAKEVRESLRKMGLSN